MINHRDLMIARKAARGNGTPENIFHAILILDEILEVETDLAEYLPKNFTETINQLL